MPEQAKQTEVIRQFQAGEVTDIVEAAMSLPVASGEKRAMYAADFGEWAHNPDSDLRWLSPIFMPRWASRITLEITDVRVERIQDISEADAIAEGIEPNWIGPLDKGPNGAGSDGWLGDSWRHYTNGVDGEPAYTPAESYRSLWDSINAKRAPWDSNPWVWCISFRRV